MNLTKIFIAILILALLCALAWGTCERNKNVSAKAKQANTQIKANSATIRKNNDTIAATLDKLLQKAQKAELQAKRDSISLLEIRKRLNLAITQRPNEKTYSPADSTLVRFGYITRP